ncbi:YbaB/EbfC family nucleoid-associated protein [Labedaea rhizosphaerae]|uniref:YbaB/EbfC DNA-binding family protein n=1 Tax=Labedaea rhizosphaerae TaxID=598644 RepID=A0A4R6SC53_LABRH|nr:YbaB/EbfC family nucleoid-associated protein [Labedaea rhizosphaerae]TDP97540.1 YbaB/EbfC DNA-binding family protein [Labedaea rhizosphaerae]
MNGMNGMVTAAADAERQLDDVVETAIRRAEAFTEARHRIDEVTVTHRSPDGAVSVTVRASGAVLDVTCSELVRTMPPHQVAATFQACVQAAQAGVARRMEGILRAAAPGDPLTDELVADAHKAFPPPQVPTVSTKDAGPQYLAIGDIEDHDPRPQQRRRPLRPGPVDDDPDDWSGRSVLS